MQTFLPEIKQLLADWYLLTLENPLYTATLVILTWLLTVFFYRIRIYFFKKKQKATEQVGIKLQGKLDETQLQHKQSEEKVIAIEEQLSGEQQLATEFAGKVDARNQQVIENIKSLAGKFNLSEQLVASDEKPKAEFVWQQQDNIQLQLTECLHAERQAKSLLEEGYRQEKEQFSSQKTLVGQLQKTLDLQINQFAKIEQELDAEKLLRQEQENVVEQKIAKELENMQAKHELATATLRNDLKLHSEPLNIDAEGKQKVETEIENEVFLEDLRGAESQSQEEFFEPELAAQREELVAEPEVIVTDPVVEIVPIVESEPKIIVTEPVVDVLEPPVTKEKRVESQAEPVLQDLDEAQEEYEPDYAKSDMNLGGKIKGLFGKKKATKFKPEKQAKVSVAEMNVSEPENLKVRSGSNKPNLDIGGKFKGLLGKGKKRTDEPQQAKVPVVERRVPEAEASKVKPDYSKSALNVGGKFKGLFSKSKKRSGKQSNELAAEVLVPKPETSEVIPDYSEPSPEIGGTFKGLFDKDEKQSDKVEQKPEELVVEVSTAKPERLETKLNESESNISIVQSEQPAGNLQVAEVLMTETPETEPDEEYEPDYAQSNLKILGKLKKLFGKS